MRGNFIIFVAEKVSACLLLYQLLRLKKTVFAKISGNSIFLLCSTDNLTTILEKIASKISLLYNRGKVRIVNINKGFSIGEFYA